MQLPVREAADGCITGEAVRPPLSGACQPSVASVHLSLAGLGRRWSRSHSLASSLCPGRPADFPREVTLVPCAGSGQGALLRVQAWSLEPWDGTGQAPGPSSASQPQAGHFPSSQEPRAALSSRPGALPPRLLQCGKQSPCLLCQCPWGMGRSLPPSQVPLEFAVPRGHEAPALSFMYVHSALSWSLPLHLAPLLECPCLVFWGGCFAVCPAPGGLRRGQQRHLES